MKIDSESLEHFQGGGSEILDLRGETIFSTFLRGQNLREAEKIFQFFVKKRVFLGFEKSSGGIRGGKGPFPGGGGFTPTLDIY